jgi:Spy/CpxP family protein refolding chaperone
MKRFRKYLLYAFICSFLASASAYAGEQCRPDCRGHSHSEKWDWKGERLENKIYKDLKLTAEQKKLLEENKKANRERAKACFEKMRLSKAELNQALMQKELDMSKINQIQSQIKALQTEMVDDRLNSVLEIRKVLTPEQFSQFISFTEKHGKREHKKKR